MKFRRIVWGLAVLAALIPAGVVWLVGGVGPLGAALLAGLGLLVLAVPAVRNFLNWLGKGLHDSPHFFAAECLTPPSTQQSIRYILRTFRRIAETKDFVYWIDYGTLLGAYRLGDLVPWDHDGDISYLAEHKPLIDACRDELASYGIELDQSHYAMVHQGARVDLVSWRRFGDRLCRVDPKLRTGVSALHDPVFEDFPVDWIEPRWQIQLLDELWPTPNHPDRMLRHRYLTFRIHPKLNFPRKICCWRCRAYWRRAAEIKHSGYQPLVVRPQDARSLEPAP